MLPGRRWGKWWCPLLPLLLGSRAGLWQPWCLRGCLRVSPAKALTQNTWLPVRALQRSTALWPWLFCLLVLLAWLWFHPCPRFPSESSAFADDHSNASVGQRRSAQTQCCCAAFCTSWCPLMTVLSVCGESAEQRIKWLLINWCCLQVKHHLSCCEQSLLWNTCITPCLLCSFGLTFAFGPWGEAPVPSYLIFFPCTLSYPFFLTLRFVLQWKPGTKHEAGQSDAVVQGQFTLISF